MQSSHGIGALALHTANLKLQLRNESRLWKVQYSNKVHNQVNIVLFILSFVLFRYLIDKK